MTVNLKGRKKRRERRCRIRGGGGDSNDDWDSRCQTDILQGGAERLFYNGTNNGTVARSVHKEGVHIKSDTG